MLIRIVTLIIALFLLLRLYRRYRRGKLSLHRTLFWSLPWLGIAVVMLFPQLADSLAARAGVVTATGVDFLVYIAVGVLVYGMFRIYIRLDRIERNITCLVREITFREASED